MASPCRSGRTWSGRLTAGRAADGAGPVGLVAVVAVTSNALVNWGRLHWESAKPRPVGASGIRVRWYQQWASIANRLGLKVQRRAVGQDLAKTSSPRRECPRGDAAVRTARSHRLGRPKQRCA